MLAVVNVGEDALDSIPELEATVAAGFNDAGDSVEVIGMCVQLEAKAAAITDRAERAEMLEGLGFGEARAFRMVRSAYHLLCLRTFLTTGDKESRAGRLEPFRRGRSVPVTTPTSSGLHPAEVINWDELLAIGSWTKAKELGKVRVDGDVIEFRLNV